MHILITRPEPDASRLAEVLRGLGHEAIIEPLMRIEYREVDISTEGVQGLIVTSRNALRWAARRGNLKELFEIPVYAVGPATATQARNLGFRKIHEGPGTARELLDVINAHAKVSRDRFLHLSGKDVANDLLPWLDAFGLPAERVVVYDSLAAENLSEGTAELLRSGKIGGVLLLSPKTSTIWVELLEAQLQSTNFTPPIAFCISEATAEPLNKLENISIKIAQKPNIEEMLAVIEEHGVES